ncbi:sensor domain-containing phosphodiesterase [Robbsia andropogonis]|uniref:sensor domain-containing phosphodiesterase n=1 Tax=Robbsia andropogonis TaxID=28092 RepID=UPI003D23E800
MSGHTMDALHRISPPLPFNDAERLRALWDSCILDTPRDPAFDAVAQAASELLQAPIAGISLVDQHRQWFKASVGVGLTDTAREDAFCAYAILQREPLIVLDARCDARFADNPLVTSPPGVRFYVGVPVRSEDGMPLGTLCVADVAPRGSVEPHVLKMLEDMAETVEVMIRMHRSSHYVDRASNLPNQRRFHENAAALRESALLATDGDHTTLACGQGHDSGAETSKSPGTGKWRAYAARQGLLPASSDMASAYWAVCLEAVPARRAEDWLACGKPERIDQHIEHMAAWLRSAVVTRDGVYRLSARHLAFFATMPRADIAKTIAALASDLHPDDAAGTRARFARMVTAIAEGSHDDQMNACAGEMQLVAMRVDACNSSHDLITALMAPRVAVHHTREVRRSIAFDTSRTAHASGEGKGAGQEYAVSTIGALTKSPRMAGSYTPVRDGCQMRVNLCAAIAEGFDVILPEERIDDGTGQAPGTGFYTADGAVSLTSAAQGVVGEKLCAVLDATQRHALLDWFSRWWTMERRTSARLQIRGGATLLAQSPRQWLDALLHVGLLPAQVEIAVPLAHLCERFADTQKRIRAWRELGIGVVVTGFGAGFDTVRWLPTLPLTTVCFDFRVIEAVRSTPKHARVVQRLVSLAHTLEMRVSVEGLESEEALRIARGLGIDEGSGDAVAHVLESDSAIRPALARASNGVMTGSANVPLARHAVPLLRQVGDAPAVSGCQHGEVCNAGCIPPRMSARDSVTRASMYPRFRFQS